MPSDVTAPDTPRGSPAVRWCLKKGATQRGPDELQAADDAVRDQPRRVYRCRRCDTELADHDAVFGVGGRDPVQVHSNPAGLLFEIVTLLAARNVFLIGERTDHFTWFPGYAWEIAHCVGCSTHLGWRFSAVGPAAAPALFYGLLVSRMRMR